MGFCFGVSYQKVIYKHQKSIFTLIFVASLPTSRIINCLPLSMSTKRHKSAYCRNCYHVFGKDQQNNYCPSCGQENNNHSISFGALLREWIRNYIAIDAKYVRTITSLVTKPGFLTTEFAIGKLQPYLSPIRLYFVASFLYFALFSFWYAPEQITRNIHLPSLDTLTQDLPDTVFVHTKIPSNKQKDSIVVPLNNKQALDLSSDTTYPLFSKDIKKALRLLKQYPAQVVVDSLKANKSQLTQNSISTFFTLQALKVAKNSGVDFFNYLLGLLPLVVFLMTPAFAFILWLLHIRSKRYYVEHLVFALHFHAFLYFLLAAYMLLCRYQTVNCNVLLIGSLLLYLLLATRKMYDQSWIKSIVKVFLFSIVYPFVVIGYGLFALLSSFLLF